MKKERISPDHRGDPSPRERRMAVLNHRATCSAVTAGRNQEGGNQHNPHHLHGEPPPSDRKEHQHRMIRDTLIPETRRQLFIKGDGKQVVVEKTTASTTTKEEAEGRHKFGTADGEDISRTDS